MPKFTSRSNRMSSTEKDVLSHSAHRRMVMLAFHGRMVMLAFSLWIEATVERHKNFVTPPKCSIYENKQNHISENLAMPQAVSEVTGCNCKEVKHKASSRQSQTSDTSD